MFLVKSVFIFYSFFFEKQTYAYTMAEEQKEETKETSEKKEITFPEFLSKRFECLFERNRMLHLGLKETLDKKFETLEKRVEELESNLKEGFLYHHRDILEGLKQSNEELCQFLLQPFPLATPTEREPEPTAVVDLPEVSSG